MNWKEHAHLFCNGKFNFGIDYDGEISVCELWAYNHPSQFHLYEFESMESAFIDISDCTLIAHKIEDMTDEEVKEMYSIPGNSVESLKQMRDFTEMKANNGNLKFSEAIYLLSIGVYPFDQSHFEDGTVIDVNLSKPTQHTEK